VNVNNIYIKTWLDDMSRAGTSTGKTTREKTTREKLQETTR
jgi:hypothetical protein